MISVDVLVDTESRTGATLMQFVNLVNAIDHVPLSDFCPHGLWSIIETSARREEVVMESDPENPFPRVIFDIDLRRKPC